MPADIELVVDGIAYRGWTQMAVTRAMDAASGAFNLTISDRDPEQAGTHFVAPGASCTVRLDGETLITGYIDKVSPSFGPEDHTIQVTGRDRTADMIDASAVHSPDEWRSISLERLAAILCAPFGIPVTVAPGASTGAKLTEVKLQQGESAFEALDRYCRMRKLLLMPDGKGGLLITRTGRTRATTPLVQGRNILRASGTLDASQRFSEYIVRAQGNYSEDGDGEAEAHIEARVKDPGMPRYRPKLIIADADANTASAKERATWECNTAIGKATACTITVQGWRQAPGAALWTPNLLVQVDAPFLRMNGLMLIRQVTYTRDLNGGTTAELEIASPQAFEPEPPEPKVKKKGEKASKDQWGALAAEVGGKA